MQITKPAERNYTYYNYFCLYNLALNLYDREIAAILRQLISVCYILKQMIYYYRLVSTFACLEKFSLGLSSLSFVICVLSYLIISVSLSL